MHMILKRLSSSSETEIGREIRCKKASQKWSLVERRVSRASYAPSVAMYVESGWLLIVFVFRICQQRNTIDFCIKYTGSIVIHEILSLANEQRNDLTQKVRYYHRKSFCLVEIMSHLVLLLSKHSAICTHAFGWQTWAHDWKCGFFQPSPTHPFINSFNRIKRGVVYYCGGEIYYFSLIFETNQKRCF